MDAVLVLAKTVGSIFGFLNTKASKKYAVKLAEFETELEQMTNGTAMELQNDRRIEEIYAKIKTYQPIALAELAKLKSE
jgi:hypothetical protein